MEHKFDGWWKTFSGETTLPENRFIEIAFKGGVQSQQDEIVELRNQLLLMKDWENIAKSNAEKMISLYADKVDLQNRIKESLYHLDFNDDNDKDIAIGILKGIKDEN